jgi:hypothetical protein
MNTVNLRGVSTWLVGPLGRRIGVDLIFVTIHCWGAARWWSSYLNEGRENRQWQYKETRNTPPVEAKSERVISGNMESNRMIHY